MALPRDQSSCSKRCSNGPRFGVELDPKIESIFVMRTGRNLQRRAISRHGRGYHDTAARDSRYPLKPKVGLSKGGQEQRQGHLPKFLRPATPRKGHLSYLFEMVTLCPSSLVKVTVNFSL